MPQWLGMVIAKAPHLFGAPFAVVMVADSVNVVVAVVFALVCVRQLKRAFSGARGIDRG